MTSIEKLWEKGKETSIVSIIFLFFILLWLAWLAIIQKKKKRRKLTKKNLLSCPIRGILRAKKYDANGNYSEEYQRIKLIKYFLVEGYRQIFIEHVIKILIGHKGRNSLILKLDLLIKKNNQPFIVAEVKKKYTKRGMISAIEHQLKPAMANTWTKYGIYFDGTEKSHFLIRNEDGTFTSQRFLLTRSFKNYIKKNNSKL